MNQWEIYALCIFVGIVVGECLFIFGGWVDKPKK